MAARAGAGLQGRASGKEGQFHLLLLMVGALVLRLSFGMPYYLPGDSLNYLNAFEAFGRPGLANTLHITRLGMVLPLGVLQFLCFGVHPLLQLFPLACSVAAVFLVYQLARDLGGPTAGLLAGGLMAAVPMEVVYVPVLLPDTPLSLLALLAYWLLVRGQAGWRSALAAGLCLGLAYTCKETALFFAGPALLQAYWRRQDARDAAWLAFGVAAVVLVEVGVLWLWLGTPHFRILQTLGFAYGSKGQFAAVEHHAGWWLAQVWLKLGALFWAAHPPTAALLLGLPHLVVWALVRLGRQGMLWWPACWLAVWWGQQLVLSTIEPEPRYLQAGLPYAALLVGVGLASWWSARPVATRVMLVAPALVLCLAGAGLFKFAFAPRAAATQALYERFRALAVEEPAALVGGPSEYVLRLAEYAGLQTPLSRPGAALTHWARLSSGYSKEESETGPPAGMAACMKEQFALRFQEWYQRLGAVPAVGLSSTAELYCRASAPASPTR
ncbi:MAG: glycosyltransferase family 39 protein [Candidatus Latescibacteria bacterium]|nr:glycosyltransferase family 39 protein [Candidatus Latescibacterota bacterium]